MMKILLLNLSILLLTLISMANATASKGNSKTKMAVAGLAHGHAHWIFDESFGQAMELVGIYEPNQQLAQRFQAQYQLDPSLFYESLEDMLEKSKPQGLLAFGPISDHLPAVRAAAPRGIHVMVEKPLALKFQEAKEMQALAEKHHIHLLTNYETSWYPSTHKTAELLKSERDSLGDLRKAVFHHGHRGPKEIGVEKEFLDWLTDPAQNGGGALVDFGCYGANLMTLMMQGAVPDAVMAVTQTHKPEIYSAVEDEATIILIYPKAQAIIQASWNWPFDRKDMEVYTEKGAIFATSPQQLTKKMGNQSAENLQVEDYGQIPSDPFDYFAAVIEGKITPEPYGLYTLENNLIVVKILDAAKVSAHSGQAVKLKE